MLYKKEDKKKKYVLVEPENFIPSNPDRTESVINPETVEIVSPDDGDVRQEDSSTTNKKIIVAKGENPYYESIYKAYVNSGKSKIDVYVKDVDATIFEPNKHYSFLFEDTSLAKKYKGKYLLCNKESVFVKEGEDFTTEIKLQLRKLS